MRKLHGKKTTMETATVSEAENSDKENHSFDNTTEEEDSETQSLNVDTEDPKTSCEEEENYTIETLDEDPIENETTLVGETVDKPKKKVKSKKKKTSIKRKSAVKNKPVKTNLNDDGKEMSTDDETDYEVEKVMGQRIYKGLKQYKIRWKGYSPKHDTWQNEDDLNCKDKIDEFLKTKTRGRKSSNVPKKVTPVKRKVSAPVKSPAAKKIKRALVYVTSRLGQNSSSSDSETEYEVQEILDTRKKRGKTEFQVRWKGFSAEHDTWEPEQNLNCKQLIADFLAIRAGKKKPVPVKSTASPPKRFANIRPRYMGRRSASTIDEILTAPRSPAPRSPAPRSPASRSPTPRSPAPNSTEVRKKKRELGILYEKLSKVYHELSQLYK